MPLFRPGEIRTYIWRSAFFFCKDSIANESQLTIGEMYIRPYFYRSWRSFDERFFPVLFCFLCLLIVIICQSCFTLFDLWKKKERAREIRRTSKKFSHGSRVVFFFVRIIDIFVSWIVDSSGFALFVFHFFWNAILSALSFWMYLFWTSSFDDTRYCDNETMIHSILLRRPDWSTPVNQCRYSAIPH